MFRQQRSFVHFRTIGLCAGVLLWLGGSGASAQDRAIPLEACATFRAPALPERQQDHFRLAIEKAGLLTLDLSAPHLLTVEPTLEVVAARPGSRIYWVDQPREVEVTVATGAPGQLLGSYRLRSAFVADTAPVMEAISPLGDPPYSCSLEPTSLGDPWSGSRGVVVSEAVDEWDCDVLEGQTLAPGVLRLDSRLGTLWARLFGGDTCSNETLLGTGVLSALGQVLAPLFPGPFRVAVDAVGGFAGAYLLGAALLDPCHQGEQDDHHDAWICATPLLADAPVQGQVFNGHGDDLDQFTFLLAEPATVRLELASPADGFRLRIANAAGQAIEGASGPALWQASLPSGRYFVSVDRPDGSSAAYGLTRSTLP